MAAPKGNQFWKARSSHGANPTFATSDDLWDACQQYFEWVDANPLEEGKVAQSQGKPVVVKLNKMRAMTISGLCIFLDIAESTWHNWRHSRKDFLEVMTRVEQIIRTQKFEGASADLLNPNIIARDLGLADKRDNTSSDGTMSPKAALDVSKLSKEAMAEILAAADASDNQD